MLKHLILFLSIATLLPGQERPNVIYIMADDLGYGDLGCYGSEKIQTPNIDRLAAEGMRFTDFYAGTTVCAPSRCVLMTGQHTGRCWVRGNAGANNAEAQTLRDEDKTVAEVFKDAGYTTGLFGKWGLGEVGTTGDPNKQGFDYMYGYVNQHHAHNYYTTYLMRNGEKVNLRNVPEMETEGRGDGWAMEKVDYSHDLIADEAVKWLDENHDKPFFLYVPFTTPHANNEATRGTGDGQEVPDYGIYKDKDWPRPDKGQAAMVTRMDGDVGRLMALLKKHHIDEKTLVFFTSDNGPHREGGNNPKFFKASGPLQGLKRALYEGGIRVPMIARWPGKIKAGSVSDHMGYFGDFMATVCELTDQPLPPETQSISFLPTLTGNNEMQAKAPYLYWEFYEQGSRQAVRFGKWKAIREPMLTGEVQLYDLSKDIGEEKDLSEQNSEMVRKAIEYMNEAHVDDPKWVVPSKRPQA